MLNENLTQNNYQILKIMNQIELNQSWSYNIE